MKTFDVGPTAHGVVKAVCAFLSTVPYPVPMTEHGVKSDDAAGTVAGSGLSAGHSGTAGEPSVSYLVALSGGPDSVALLLALVAIRAAAAKTRAAPDLRMYACWVNHRLRPADELVDEERFVRSLCDGLDVPLYTESAGPGQLEREAKEAGGIEAAARAFRYKVLETVRLRAGADWVCTGHNADDGLETMIMRFFTGSGAAGLRGMASMHGRVVRPMLSVTRADICDYLASAGQVYRTDSTNASDDYLRNRVRHHLVPAVLDVFPDAREALATLAGKATLDEEALDGYARQLFHPGQSLAGQAGAGVPAGATVDTGTASDTLAQTRSDTGAGAAPGTGAVVGTDFGVLAGSDTGTLAGVTRHDPPSLRLLAEIWDTAPLAVRTRAVYLALSTFGIRRAPWNAVVRAAGTGGLADVGVAGARVTRKDGYILIVPSNRGENPEGQSAQAGVYKPGPAGWSCLLPSVGRYRIGTGAIVDVYSGGGGAVARPEEPHHGDGVPHGNVVIPVRIPTPSGVWPLWLRSRRPGDSIHLEAGTVKVDDLLGAMKIPGIDRDLVPVMEDDHGLLAVLASSFGGRDVYRTDTSGSAAVTPDC